MVSAANMAINFGIVGSVTQLIRWYFNTGDIVYYKKDFRQPAGAGRSLPKYEYKILTPEVIVGYPETPVPLAPQFMSGVQVNGIPTIGATCSGAPYSPAINQLLDITTPFYYWIQRVDDSQLFFKVHESELMPHDTMIQYNQAGLPVWWFGN